MRINHLDPILHPHDFDFSADGRFLVVNEGNILVIDHESGKTYSKLMPHLLQANQRVTLRQPYRSAQMDTSYLTRSRMRQEAVNYFCTSDVKLTMG